MIRLWTSIHAFLDPGLDPGSRSVDIACCLLTRTVRAGWAADYVTTVFILPWKAARWVPRLEEVVDLRCRSTSEERMAECRLDRESWIGEISAAFVEAKPT
jgi:hypothetical protein